MITANILIDGHKKDNCPEAAATDDHANDGGFGDFDTSDTAPAAEGDWANTDADAGAVEPSGDW